ncbi:MAG: hypothetical protein M1838_003471 [Thelocarpon superellum]|nr:MAG: hypothetical protein M1838_003471 [Thelocarpon superellum]
MAEVVDSLGGIQGLYQDLVAVSESRLSSVERLVSELEATIADFKKLVDKAPKNDKSRQALNAGKITVAEEEYTVNDDFKQAAIQLADTLDLDELDAARLFLAAQDEAAALDRPVVESALILFQEQRQFLLESLRLVCRLSLDDDLDLDPDLDADDAARPTPTGLRPVFQEAVALIVQAPPAGPGRSAPSFPGRCLTAMAQVRHDLRQLAARVQGAAVVGAHPMPQVAELQEVQRSSLTSQHESLAAIVTHLTKARYLRRDDFRALLDTVQLVDRPDHLLVHLMPPLTQAIAAFASAEGGAAFDDAQELHRKLVPALQRDSWPLAYLQAAVLALWLSEYSSWYVDTPEPPRLTDGAVEGEEEAESRSDLFLHALKRGALDFLLALSIDVKPAEWYDPVRATLRGLLQKKAPGITADTIPFSDAFQVLLLEQLEGFADAFITNMPATLRRLRLEEDQERLESLELGPTQDYDLEKFIVMLSYVYEHRPIAALSFWQDADSNLFGFLQWVSRRLSTPRACAVCEMLLALSEGEDNATAAHHFLLDEGAVSTSKVRRTNALNWTQIFYEAHYFSSKIRDAPALPQPPTTAFAAGPDRTDRSGGEPETLNMLESYLRLTARLTRESATARAWLLAHPTVRILDLLFHLASNAVGSHLRACAFDALQAVLKDKSAELGEMVWSMLDQWIAGGVNPLVARAKLAPAGGDPRSDGDGVWASLGLGFEEPHAFVRLLQALVYPAVEQRDLHDALPFPETLGSSYREPGIEAYVDFAMGRVFALKRTEIIDVIQARNLRLVCIEFIMTCLSTFNEDLIILANRSNIAVDAVMATSSLAAYARLHPFGRVMEWLFNDGVVAALIDTIHQDAIEVSRAAPHSPLIAGVVGGIQVVIAVLKLQPTYLDIVRPLIKAHAGPRRVPVADATLASFEDAILNRLELVVDLGLYCGLGHADLTLASLTLLEQLSTSRKMIAAPSRGAGPSGSNKVLGILQVNDEYERISKALAAGMQPNARELDAGPDAPGYLIKASVLSFLHRCLTALPHRPAVAHLLLGFTCAGDRLEVGEDGTFAHDAALFDAVLRIVVDYPDGSDGQLEGWMLRLRQAALDVLRQLWSAPLSSVYTMLQLRQYDLVSILYVRQPLVGRHALFDGRTASGPDFLLDRSASCFESFLRQRAAVLDYSATEVRLLKEARAPTLQARLLATLLGTTTTPEGEELTHPSVLDLFDFVDLELGDRLAAPPLRFYADIDFRVCLREDEDPPRYELASVRQLLLLRQKGVHASGLVPGGPEEADMLLEAENLCAYCDAENQRGRLVVARLETLKAWVALVLVMLDRGEFVGDAKRSFILQTLQLILPKLERYALTNATEALSLARLSQALLVHLDLGAPGSSLGPGRAGDVAQERLFQLFRVCLRGITSPVATAALREIFYVVCYRYLVGMADVANPASSQTRHRMRTVRAAGERLTDVLCDDADGGEGTCPIAALFLLDALVALAQDEDSTYLVDALARLNFIGIMVEAIKHMPAELRAMGTSGESAPGPSLAVYSLTRLDLPLLLSYDEAKLSLLVRIAHTRAGATQILHASLFHAVRESGLFALDPDLGLDLEHPMAMTMYYRLLLAVIRLLSAVLISRGDQHEQTMEQGRAFLSAHRASIVAMFKRQAKIGGIHANVDEDGAGDLADVVENFMVLITMTRFLEVEDAPLLPRSTMKIFT